MTGDENPKRERGAAQRKNSLGENVELEVRRGAGGLRKWNKMLPRGESLVGARLGGPSKWKWECRRTARDTVETKSRP